MLKPDQIPAEAVEAARKFMRLQALSDEWIDDLLAAAINAWPGMHDHDRLVVRDNGEGYDREVIGLILPLTEPRDE